MQESTPCKQLDSKLYTPKLDGVDMLTPGPGHIELFHRPNFRDPDEIYWPVGQEGMAATVSQASKLLLAELGFISLQVQFNCH